MLVLGIDCSTTATKAIAWDARGTAVAQGRAAFPLSNPARDAWEQDAESWWTATVAAVSECARALGTRAKSVRALALTHQRETFVLTDAGGVPLRPAVVWMDSRGRPAVTDAIARMGAERLHRLSGKPPCVTPSLYKLMWLLEQERALRDRAPIVLDVHAFLAFRLTGRRATSLASADPLGLVDMQARCWSDELLALAGLSAEGLPELVEPGSELGRLSGAVAAKMGLEAGIPVIAGAGDGQAAGLGAGIVTSDRAYLNLGTAVVSGVSSTSYRTDPAFRTMYGATPGSFFLETDLKGGTFTLNWLAEKWFPGRATTDTLSELESAAQRLSPGSEGLMLVPYWNGVMNPYWDDDATGIVVGFTGRHGPAHLYRAVLEGIAFEQRLHTTGVERALEEEIREVVVMGGGATSDLWCQILADVSRKRVARSRSTEATALGAGVLAAVAAGLHPDIPTAIAEMTGTAELFQPGAESTLYDRLHREVYVELYPRLREPLARLTALAAIG